MKLLLEVKSVRRCEGGHTCNLIANGRKAAFIAPGIFEWTNYSKKVDVLTWFASRKASRVEEIQPVELKEGWESSIPDHKMDDARYEVTETALHEWIQLHFVAYEITQRCKTTLMTLGNKGEILDWGIAPGSKADSLKRVAASRFSSELLNGLSTTQLVEIMEAKMKAKRSLTPVKV